MVFNSYIFIFLFLPLVICGWFILNRINKNLANVFLLGMSFWFYGYFNIYYLLILIFSICINFLLSRVIISKETYRRKIVLCAGIIVNVLLIFYYKYYDFFVSNLNVLFKQNWALKNVVLPLGISFFTFQQISFLVDSYNGETKEYGFLEYSMFVSFFPQLVAGPIVLHNELIEQFRSDEKRDFNWENFAKGLCFFMNGLIKKVWVADLCAQYVDWGFNNIGNTFANETILVMLLYSMQIYFDFSGYSDMAIGISRMMNLELPINFNSPYRADSIVDFWKRWHITLTRFLRKYVYFPLGGGKRGKLRKYVNIMIVFLISGLWHGANWTFVLWGALHGILNVADRILEGVKIRMPRLAKWTINYLTVTALWALFRSNSIGSWLAMLKSVFTKGLGDSEIYLNIYSYRIVANVLSVLGLPLKMSLGYQIFLWVVFAILLIICIKGKNITERQYLFDKKIKAVVYATLFCAIALSLGQRSTFIYFNF